MLAAWSRPRRPQTGSRRTRTEPRPGHPAPSGPRSGPADPGRPHRSARRSAVRAGSRDAATCGRRRDPRGRPAAAAVARRPTPRPSSGPARTRTSSAGPACPARTCASTPRGSSPTSPARPGTAGTGAPMGVFDAAHRGAARRGRAGQPRPRPATAEIGYWVAPWARGRRRGDRRPARAVARWALRRARAAPAGLAGRGRQPRLPAGRRDGRVPGRGRAARRRRCARAGAVGRLLAGALLPGELREADAPVRPAGPPGGPPPSAGAQPRAGRHGPRAVDAVGLRPPGADDLRRDRARLPGPGVAALDDGARSPYTRADAEYFVHDFAPRRVGRAATGAVFAVADDDDAFVGSMELRLPRGAGHAADVGYLIAPWARGRGYAPAALRRWSPLGLRRAGPAPDRVARVRRQRRLPAGGREGRLHGRGRRPRRRACTGASTATPGPARSSPPTCCGPRPHRVADRVTSRDVSPDERIR